MSHRRVLLTGALCAGALAAPAGAAAASLPAGGAWAFTASALGASAAGLEAQRSQAAAPASAPAAKIREAKTFSLALGAKLTRTNLGRLAKRDLVVVDGDEASAAQVKRLQAKGAVVLGYLSVGTVESWRPWFNLLRDHRLEELGDWDGERYADVSAEAVRTALVDTISTQLLTKGFDGLFLDNLDMVDTHPAQSAGMLDLVTRLSTKVRGAGGVLMAQNGDAMIAPYLPLLDAWNREDPTGTFDFETGKYAPTDAEGRRAARAAIGAVKKAGLVVTTTDYYASSSSKGARQAVRIACKAGAVPFVGDIDLEKVSSRAPSC